MACKIFERLIINSMLPSDTILKAKKADSKKIRHGKKRARDVIYTQKWANQPIMGFLGTF